MAAKFSRIRSVTRLIASFSNAWESEGRPSPNGRAATMGPSIASITSKSEMSSGDRSNE